MSEDTDPLTLRHLTDLQEALTAAGLHVTLTSRDGRRPPHLRVSVVPELAEQIYCEPAEGDWWFWWSWAERIAPVTDLTRTAERIARVVAPVHA